MDTKGLDDFNMKEPKRQSKTRSARGRHAAIKGRPARLLFAGIAVLLIVGIAVLVVLLTQSGAGASAGGESGGTTSPDTTAGSTTAPTTAPEGVSGHWVVEGEKAYYVDDAGNPYTGVQTIAGAEYTFQDDGSLLDGWVTIDNVRYHFSGGVLSKGTQVIDGITRYINADGTMFVGWYDNPNTGGRYYYDFETGRSFYGWQEIDGKIYYFRQDGTLARGTIVDGVVIDDEGIAAGWPSETTSSTRPPAQPETSVSDSLGAALDNILATYGSTPREIYNYVHDHYTYKYAPEASIEENAQYMLDHGTGSCYNFASLTYLLFERAGYDVYYVTGKGWQPGDYHCWILAYFDGGWYYVDSLYTQSAKLTAAELEAKGYEWDKSAYPG